LTLAPGTRLGAYEITASLGEGGMGEVYRATDAQLKREVAIKVLPAQFIQDKERRTRFEREAQLLAQLQHPNIASIYGLEESDGTRALVMELVDGPTLAERLEQGPLPLDEAISVSLRIAQALEAAHEKGIVHRDLKPQNIKAPVEGTVKVLDFGLAKAMAPADEAAMPASSSSLAASPTLTLGATQMGVILGTAAYMSPEQAKGMAVDRRADIWAFGVVLYEMLTGAQLFQAPTVPETLAQVLTREPDLQALPSSTPTAVRELLRRCLARNPKNRLHDMADARIVLDEIARGVPDEAGPAEAPAKRAGAGALVGAAAAALVLGAAVGWFAHRAPPVHAATARFALAIPDGYDLSSAEFPQLAMSSDGRQQVAVVVGQDAVPRLLLRTVEEFEPRLLPDTERAISPVFSPDGQWVAFFRDTHLFKLAISGGAPVQLVETTTQPRGLTWSRDGFLYFSPDTISGLFRVPEGGGAATQVTTPVIARDERTHRWPSALPDGSAVIFTNDSHASTEFYDDARIEAVRPETGERTLLVEGASFARWSPGGLVFARGGGLYTVELDPASLTVRGPPRLVVRGVATDVGSGAVQFALSSSGDALWAPGGAAASYRLAWMSRDGVETQIDLPPAPYNEAELSPDGRRVALTGGEGGVADLWVADLERGTVTRLTIGEQVESPVWSLDGLRIAYSTRRRNAERPSWAISWRTADGSRDAEQLLEQLRQVVPNAFTSDGRLVYSARKPDGNGMDIFRLSLDGDREPEPLVVGQHSESQAALSPDERWLAYVSDEGGRPNVYVRPYAGGEGRWQISATRGTEPRWGPGGRELFFRDGATLYRVAIADAREFTAGRPQRLFDRVASGSAVHTYAPAPAGDRIFTYRSPEGRGELRTLHLDIGFAQRVASRTAGP
jgi:Tol biopolymer transport system component/tRNA A-37 threonylcarbamoyl transferase component Bud32